MVTFKFVSYVFAIKMSRLSIFSHFSQLSSQSGHTSRTTSSWASACPWCPSYPWHLSSPTWPLSSTSTLWLGCALPSGWLLVSDPARLSFCKLPICDPSSLTWPLSSTSTRWLGYALPSGWLLVSGSYDRSLFSSYPWLTWLTLFIFANMAFINMLDDCSCLDDC